MYFLPAGVASPFSFYPFFSPCRSSFIWISENQSRFGLKNSFLTVHCVMRAIFKCRDALLDPGITGRVETLMENCYLSLISVSLNVMVTIFGDSCLEEWEGEGILREVGAVGAFVKDSRAYKLWPHDWWCDMAEWETNAGGWDVCRHGRTVGRRILKDTVVM